MVTPKPRRLGRGLSSLIQPQEPVRVEAPGMDIPTVGDDAGISTGSDSGVGISAQSTTGGGASLVVAVPTDRITPSRFQPRRLFDDDALERLASSIRRSGLMQPIIVRPASGGGFELVAGERRWRAAQRAGLSEVPAVVRELGDADAAEWALVENLQREELNPMERGHGLRNLAERFGLSHAVLGERLGLDRSTVANLIRLTELEEAIQTMVREGSLSMGHARALLGLPAGAVREALAVQAASDSCSVREMEARVRRAGQTGQEPHSEHNTNITPTQRELVISDIERRLGDHLGTKARISLRAGGNRGYLRLEFYSLEQFEGLMERIGLADESEL